MPRFYLSLPLDIGAQLTLPENVAHHIRVLRLKLGESIVLFNGRGGEYEAYVMKLDKRSVTVTIDNYRSIERESPLHLVLVQAISAPERMDYTIQKAAELGVTVIQPVFSQYSQRYHLGQHIDKRIARWQQIAMSACEQSGRTRLTQIHAPLRYEDCLKIVQAPRMKLLLSPVNGIKPNLLPAAADSVMVLVGPEGGFSAQEEAIGIASGCTPLTLGPRTLRTETVAPVISALLQSRYGDW